MFAGALMAIFLAVPNANALAACNGQRGGSRCGYELIVCEICGNVGCQHVNCVYAKPEDKFCCTNGWKGSNGWCAKCGDSNYRHLN